MKTKTEVYEAPAVYEHEMFVEGVLCGSLGGDNESYGGDPLEDDSIF